MKYYFQHFSQAKDGPGNTITYSCSWLQEGDNNTVYACTVALDGYLVAVETPEAILTRVVYKMSLNVKDPTFYDQLENFLNSGATPAYASGGIINGVTKSNEPPEVKELPGLSVMVEHPVTELDQCVLFTRSHLKSMIIHLNDRHRWTRIQIADWLDEISDPTGENGPDLRFSSRPAKVVQPNKEMDYKLVKGSEGWKPLGTTKNNHYLHHYHDSTFLDDYATYTKFAQQQLSATFNLGKIDPETAKLLFGEEPK